MFFKYRRLHNECIEISNKSGIMSGLDDTGDTAHIDVTQMSNGECAEVIRICHNSRSINRLEAMGIIPGAIITKKSAIPAKGPVIIGKGSVQFAVGYNMAQKIIVRLVDMNCESGV
jgi:Fe2+ transport system protein FeoA